MTHQRIILTPQSLTYAIQEITKAADGHHQIELGPLRRTSEQNKKYWASLGDIAEQVVWYGQKLTDKEWSYVMSAALKRTKIVPAIDGNGFVVLAQETSRMGKQDFSELIELTLAFGAERGVKFRDDE